MWVAVKTHIIHKLHITHKHQQILHENLRQLKDTCERIKESVMYLNAHLKNLSVIISKEEKNLNVRNYNS